MVEVRLSLADALSLGDAVDLLPFGIATPGATGSVHVWSHRPMAALGGAAIGVTDETSTSVQIARMLLEQRYGVKDVRWTTLDDEADAVLLIGDAALRQRGRPWRFAHCTDLGTEWAEWTGLTAVFAIQAFVIIGGVTRVIPLTGVTLPFISYAGSSIVANFVLVALLLLVSDRARREAVEPSGREAVAMGSL